MPAKFKSEREETEKSLFILKTFLCKRKLRDHFSIDNEKTMKTMRIFHNF